MTRLAATLNLLLLLVSAPAFAQYNASAGQSAPTERVRVQTTDADGKTITVEVNRPVASDSHGNAAGTKHDLAADGAFDGQTVVVLQLYTGTDLGTPFDFEKPRAALKEKGFSVYRWTNAAPSPAALEAALAKASQLWIISGDRRHLTDAHLPIIRKFFESGRGLYLWGDNPPYTGDANFVAGALFDTRMSDSTYAQGEQVVFLRKGPDQPGILRDHLLTTGLEYLYEGHTVATLPPKKGFVPLIRGSANDIVTAFYDQQGRRAILDGGFTRLYLKWETAGTGRYVKNAAAWLANAERFGDEVVSHKAHAANP